jgi:putative ABC transport system permease protein
MVLATLLASLFGAANSVSMSVRERTREVGILRSLGFRRMHVLALLTGESTFIAVFGGLIGIGASWLLLASEKMLGGIVPVTVTPLTVAIGVGMAILVGLLGAIVPAVAATRVKIVDTLRFVD